MSDTEGDYLIIILDTCLLLASNQETKMADVLRPDSLLQQLLYFMNSYLLLQDRNKLAVLALHETGSPILYQSSDEGGGSAISPAKAITERLSLLLEKTIQTGPRSGDLPLAGALSRALCLINRRKLESHRNTSKRSPRILCLVGSTDSPVQYIPVMNSIFAAQKARVAIDACILHHLDSPYLQQATDITEGIYVKPSHRAVLLQYLLHTFCADTHTRTMLQLQKGVGVDFRASCFCHKSTIDIGYVCSVCLSIFCQPSAQCTTCGTVFKGRPKKVPTNTTAPMAH